ncbi:helix-turn-helix domain-containing protein [Chryseolinea lacunae]|uniref:Helix-turn-helix transcriptional regulator n=1 Tax=Chryseolinea lacunae TaxID=2801331 RepID=A0ABS1KZS3_9BACT|nr:helix-turn-helix transcriptional regulator [Chryseolinea lacunae]
MRKIERKESLVRFGKRLKGIREAANVTQEQIHYATGITQPYISAVESGALTIGLSHIAVLAEFFGLEEYELFQYKSQIPEPDQLKKNITSFLKRNDIDPSTFLKKGLTHLLKGKVLSSKFFTTPKYTSEIRSFLYERFDANFTTTAISQALENLRKQGLVDKIATDKKSKFQYKSKE